MNFLTPVQSGHAAEYFKSRNFMTPEVVETGFLKAGPNGKTHYAYEISTGMFMKHRFYGVTINTTTKGKTDLSKPFESLVEAQEYLTQIPNPCNTQEN